MPPASLGNPKMLNSDEPQGFTAEEHALFEKLNIGKEGGLPLPSFIKPSEVEAQARPLAESIFRDWEVLKAVVERHEERLLERWRGLKRKKRRDMLLAAWPGMAPQHRPDIVCWREKFGETNRQAVDREDREAFLWPHINLQDLCATRPLWLLMRSRGRDGGPEAFAAADLDGIRFGKACLALMPRYLNQYSMLFTGRTTAESYGQLYAWDELPSGDRSLFENRGTHPGEGLWILEIQARLYAFLVDMAKRLIPGVTDTLSNKAPPAAVNSNHARPDAAAEFQSLPVLSLEAPYSLPAQLNVQNLLNLAYAKLWEAEDHLWAMREDPSYFAATLRTWREHRREMIPDTEGKPHPAAAAAAAADDDGDNVLWSRTIGLVVKRGLEEVETWNIVYAKCHLVAQRLRAHAGKLRPDGALPQDLALAVYSLYHHARQLQNEPVGNLKTGCFASPELRRYFRVVPPRDPGDSAIALTTAEEAPEGAATRELVWCLGALQNDGSRVLLGSSTLLDNIEMLMAPQVGGGGGASNEDGRSSSSTAAVGEQSHVSAWVADQLASLSVYAECVREIERFQPWAASFEVEMQDKEIASVLDVDFQKSLQRLRPLFQHQMRDRVVRLGVPDDGRFDYPEVAGDEDQAARAAAVEQRRRAEKALDAFWAKLQHSLDKHHALTPRVREVLTKMPIQRTSPHAAKPSASSEAAASSPQPKPIRGGSAAAKKKVDRRALKTFRALFPPDAASSSEQGAAAAPKSWTAAEVAWPDFVHAMRSARFDITKLYGSAWLFVPERQTGGGGGAAAGQHRPILFHQPWPGTGKISPPAARWLGKRLTRAFGWTRETFEVEA
ncbi:uncharacterized protein E0L32_000392 [Thyridium curvatum]|uniref:Uncharacterized protein n=1 Tax=Thyridium curvatum TaxID=1093900 RepID=A0A507BH52_9PEZI|nr:uncharacterized protein E0L32_000392 [Thyridium curvatum]TPX16058.1 hypothetical protein E0L32_000392 [Thyridium curvatum]